MVEIEYIQRDPEARVLVVSQRLLERSISRATIFEFEDLICQLDRADLVAPTKQLRSDWSWRVDRKVIAVTGRPGPLLRTPSRLTERDYELLMVCCEDMHELTALRPLRAWHDAAKLSACYIEELWDADIPLRPGEIALIKEFDLVFTSCGGAIPRLRQATGKPCAHLPPAVDAVRFCPYPNPPVRCIDIYNMGRRSTVAHEALHELADARNWFYVYDTFRGNKAIDPADHRKFLANTIKRTRYFVANRAKVDHGQLTERQEELGSRHFEGAAGGAVIVGDPPRCETFDEHFGWPDAVVPMEFDVTDPAAVIDVLEADPDRVARIRADNVRNCLRRHDWSYRWRMVLEAAGMKALSGMTERAGLLSRLASGIPGTSGQPTPTPKPQ